MLIHISIPAKNPIKVAQVLAELVQGITKPFPPLENAYMVYTNNEFACGFEVYPEDIILKPGIKTNEPSQFTIEKNANPYSTTHCAIKTPLSKKMIITIAEREQWRWLYTRRRDAFAVIEFWLENRFLLELIIAEDWEEAKQHLTTSI